MPSSYLRDEWVTMLYGSDTISGPLGPTGLLKMMYCERIKPNLKHGAENELRLIAEVSKYHF
jgi:hypothetical protein